MRCEKVPKCQAPQNRAYVRDRGDRSAVAGWNLCRYLRKVGIESWRPVAEEIERRHQQDEENKKRETTSTAFHICSGWAGFPSRRAIRRPPFGQISPGAQGSRQP